MRQTNCRRAFLLILPSLLGISVFYVIPFFSSLYYAFTQGVSEARFVGLDNFKNLLQNAMFLRAEKNTAMFLAVAVPLALALAIAVSVISVKAKFTWQRWALLLPMVAPASSLCVGWQTLWSETGPINQLLSRLGMGPVAFLRESSFGLLLALYLLKNVGYLSVILASAIRSLPPVYQESYRLDSSSELGYVRHILLPLIGPTLLFAAIVAMMNYFLLFRDIYSLYANDPPAPVYMLQHFMNNNFYKLNYQLLGSAAFLTVLLMTGLVAVMLAVQRRAKRHVG